jgi:hypothetical protein
MKNEQEVRAELNAMLNLAPRLGFIKRYAANWILKELVWVLQDEPSVSFLMDPDRK